MTEEIETNNPIKPRKIHTVKVVRGACISAATCIVIAPDAFEFDDEGIAIVKPGYLKVDDNTLLMAAQSCPTQAIVLYDELGNQIFPKI